MSTKVNQYQKINVCPLNPTLKLLVMLIHVLFGHIPLGVHVLKHVVLVRNHEMSLVTWNRELLMIVNVL